VRKSLSIIRAIPVALIVFLVALVIGVVGAFALAFSEAAKEIREAACHG